MDTVSFRRMDEGTAEDYELLARHEDDMLRELPDRMLEAVAALDRSYGGYKVTRKEHSLQSATRAYRDERDEEYAVAALLHDVGDVLAPHTHARERYRGHPWLDACAEFCERYDQNCFDPDYEPLPLEFFEPMVRRVFAEPRYLERGSA